ncbi:TBC1 domain family member 19 like protein [Aduncisulcus paluster]|uniref:TBC1 domain family member 19 like protein n=1 Tax=Aduncisulcus paluster TaxID=2918883 RepID=A0ABQ5JU23_9EUKA|nr:TBC1 domain family member 19 like protein [Aduncisulcus paluster]
MLSHGEYLQFIEESEEFWRARLAAKEEILKPQYKISTLSRKLPSILDSHMTDPIRDVGSRYMSIVRSEAQNKETSILPPSLRAGLAIEKRKKKIEANKSSSSVTSKSTSLPLVTPSSTLLTPSSHYFISLISRKLNNVLEKRAQDVSKQLRIPLIRENEYLMKKRRALPEDSADSADKKTLKSKSSKSSLSGSEQDEEELYEEAYDAIIVREQELSECFLYQPNDIYDFFVEEMKDIPHKADSSMFRVTKEQGGFTTIFNLDLVSFDELDVDCLSSRFKGLHPSCRQCGDDDKELGWFAEYSHRQFSSYLTSSSRMTEFEMREKMQSGVPHGQRKKAWGRVLNIPSLYQSTSSSSSRYSAFLDSVNTFLDEAFVNSITHPTLTDTLIRMDIRACVTNEFYFVFESEISDVMCALVRDDELLMCLKKDSLGMGKGKYSHHTYDHTSSTLPPSCSILPFKGISLFFAPFFFLTSNTAEAYVLGKEMYLRYFHRLHTFNSIKGGYLHLIELTDVLVKTKNRQLSESLREMKLEVPELVTPWIVSGFSGYLRPEEYFVLWDRVLAFDSTLLLAYLSAAVLLSKSKTISQFHNESDVRCVTGDFSTISVIPLLQNIMFDDEWVQ